jgi:hypothetical protein
MLEIMNFNHWQRFGKSMAIEYKQKRQFFVQFGDAKTFSKRIHIGVGGDFYDTDSFF